MSHNNPCPYCTCDPDLCATDTSGEHCADRSCGSCLHGCPTDECNPADPESKGHLR